MQRYNVQPYDTLISVANKFGIPYEQILASYPQTDNGEFNYTRYGKNRNRSIYPYIVSKGDTLNKISQKLNVPIDLILSSNPKVIRDRYIIIGQQLAIPKLEEPPTQLREIELAAEDIMDLIDTQEWDTVSSRFDTIKNNMDELKPILNDDSVSVSLIYKLDSLITDLGKSIAARNAYDSKKNANQVTLLVSYILDYYKEEIPPNIIRLDFLGREIILNVEREEWNTALDNLDYINVIWKVLKLRLNNVSEQVVTELSRIIESLGQFIKNQDSEQTIEVANDMINVVRQIAESYNIE